MGRRYRYDPKTGEMVEITRERPRAVSAAVMGDLPGYESPASGKWIEGRRARREDFKRTGTRPWEGMEAELKEADRRKAREEAQQEQLVDRMARTMWRDMPERYRKIFRSK